jgi:hypothetical protein
MVRPERMITSNEVQTVVTQGELIEDYPSDPRGHSCLMLGFGETGRAVHVVCSPKDQYLAIITAYLPDPGSMVRKFSTEALENGMHSLQRADETRYGSFQFGP